MNERGTKAGPLSFSLLPMVPGPFCRPSSFFAILNPLSPLFHYSLRLSLSLCSFFSAPLCQSSPSAALVLALPRNLTGSLIECTNFAFLSPSLTYSLALFLFLCASLPTVEAMTEEKDSLKEPEAARL